MTVSCGELADVISQLFVEPGDDDLDSTAYAEAVIEFFDSNGLAVVDRERYEAMQRVVEAAVEYAKQLKLDAEGYRDEFPEIDRSQLWEVLR